MILLQPASRFLLQILQSRANGSEKGVDLDCQSVEFDDVRYHIQFSTKLPQFMLISVSLPIPPPETVFFDGLPFGAMEAVKAAYGQFVQLLDPPKDGYNLTMKLNLSKLPSDEEQKHAVLIKIASVREVVLGAPLRVILKHLALRTVAPDMERLVALVHRPKESFFVVPQADKCSEGFMHTRMRRRVESLIEALDRAKPETDTPKKIMARSFKRLSVMDARENSRR